MRKILPDLEVIVSKTPGSDGEEMTDMTDEGNVRFFCLHGLTILSLSRAPAKICSKFYSSFCRKCTKPREYELI